MTCPDCQSTLEASVIKSGHLGGGTYYLCPQSPQCHARNHQDGYEVACRTCDQRMSVQLGTRSRFLGRRYLWCRDCRVEEQVRARTPAPTEPEGDRLQELAELMEENGGAYPGSAGQPGKFRPGGVPGGWSPWPGGRH